jgi:hypothetical protein
MADPNPTQIELSLPNLVPALLEFVESCAEDPDYKSPGDREPQPVFVLIPPDPGARRSHPATAR